MIIKRCVIVVTPALGFVALLQPVRSGQPVAATEKKIMSVLVTAVLATVIFSSSVAARQTAPTNGTFRVAALNDHITNTVNVTSREDALKVVYVNLQHMDENLKIAKGKVIRHTQVTKVYQ